MGLKLFDLVSACCHILWKKLPTPFGVDSNMALPPVDKVDDAAVQMISASSMNAASSRINKDSASERPASLLLATALICDPLANCNDSLLSVVHTPRNHTGKFACINRTLVTRFFAVSCLVAITRMFLSRWNNNSHNAYPATNVEIPICLPFKTILLSWSSKSRMASF